MNPIEDEPIERDPEAGLDDPPAGSDPDELAGLAERARQAEAQAEDSRNAYLRAVADLENYRKRVAREVDNARQFGAERLASGLLPVLDSLELGLANADRADAATLAAGQEATLKLLVKALEAAGISEIDPAGQAFDPALHEAMAMQPSDEQPPDTVITVAQKGYALNGRLLRPARVIVARPPGA
jgi:molecular chaperone GrpE